MNVNQTETRSDTYSNLTHDSTYTFIKDDLKTFYCKDNKTDNFNSSHIDSKNDD